MERNDRRHEMETKRVNKKNDKIRRDRKQVAAGLITLNNICVIRQ